jgi:hypothetical protein
VVVALLLLKHEYPEHQNSFDLKARWPEKVVNFAFYILTENGQQKQCQQRPKQIKKVIQKWFKSKRKTKKTSIVFTLYH